MLEINVLSAEQRFSFALESNYSHLGLCGEIGESGGVITTEQGANTNCCLRGDRKILPGA